MRTRRKSRFKLLALALLAGSALGSPLLVGEAQAIVGRPLTPMSYAGVARRTTRRTVVAASVVAPRPVVVAPPPVVVPPPPAVVAPPPAAVAPARYW